MLAGRDDLAGDDLGVGQRNEKNLDTEGKQQAEGRGFELGMA